MAQSGYYKPNGDLDLEKLLEEKEPEVVYFSPDKMNEFTDKVKSGDYTSVATTEIPKSGMQMTGKAGDIITYIFYYPLKSIVTILKGIFEVLRVISIPAFFGGCFCLFKYFSEHPQEWYYQLWFGIALVVSPFVVNAIYFILCQIKVKLMMRLATNKHVINRIDSL